MYTLVVVDMQDGFVAARGKKVQDQTKRAIKNAMKDRASIIFVEFAGQGPTYPCLTQLTKTYDKVHTVVKQGWDGSRESMEVIKKFKLSSKRFKVCGVYTECCVDATVQGLASAIPTSKIKVLEKACWSTDNTDHQRGLSSMLSLKNVKVV